MDAQYCVSIEVLGPDDEPVVREEQVELGLLDGRGRTIGLRITRYEFDYVPQDFGPAKWGTYTTPGHRFGARFRITLDGETNGKTHEVEALTPDELEGEIERCRIAIVQTLLGNG